MKGADAPTPERATINSASSDRGEAKAGYGSRRGIKRIEADQNRRVEAGVRLDLGMKFLVLANPENPLSGSRARSAG